MSPRSLVFVANARLPTEKAHGHAIVKLCEAFAHLGLEVELWHPRRHQFEQALRGRSVFEYYGVPPIFAVRTTANLDVVRLDEWLPDRFFRPWLVLHEAVWGAYVARRAARRAADLYVTRDLLVAWWLTRNALPTVLDVHVVPAGPRRRILCSLAGSPHLRAAVALTKGNRERLVALGMPVDRIVVAGSAVDLRQYENLPPRDECRATLGLPLDRAIVGCVGRFETLGREKGIAELVQAVGLLKQRLKPSPLLLCVGGPMALVPSYLAAARAAGLGTEDVRFVDHVPAPEVPIWIRSLDVAVAPLPDTDHMATHASPLKVYEYMAAGVPIVASDLPAMREAARGRTDVRFVPAGKVAALAGGIEQSLRCAARGARNPLASQTFSWDERARVMLRAAGASIAHSRDATC